MTGGLSSVMDAAERAQAMLTKDLATAIIVGLFAVMLVLVRALVRVTNARVEDVKAINQGLAAYIAENTKSNIALTRAVEAKVTRRRGGGSGEGGAPPAALKEGAG